MKTTKSKKVYSFIVSTIIILMFSGNVTAQNNHGGCNCSDIRGGCDYNTKCILHCASVCGHRVLISNDETNSTAIAFYMEEPGKVSLKIFDATGRLVMMLTNNYFSHGEHFLTWNNKDEKGNAVVPGIYSLRMNEKENSETEKLIVMK